MKKFDFKKIDLVGGKYEITSKRKIIFAIPIAIILIAAICMIIFHFTMGNALNLGTDFTGGYSIDVQLGTKLTDDNYNEYCNLIEESLESVEAENGETYAIRVDNFQKQGSGDSAVIHVKYFKVASEYDMTDYVNPAIQEKLQNDILMSIPTVTVADGKAYVEYDEVITLSAETLRAQINEYIANNTDKITVSADSDVALDPENPKRIIISYATLDTNNQATVIHELQDSAKYYDKYSGSIKQGNMVGATVSSELLFNAILAVCLAIVFMLCYIGLRFQLSSGLAAIIALVHDIVIMFAFMAIFHIEINSTFIAALITVLGYSINNSIIIFDRVRENMRSVYTATLTPEQVADKSIKETLIRSLNTTLTTLVMISLVAIIGVADIRIFAAPIIFGLLAGTFSSITIAPSFWALFQRVGKGKKVIKNKPEKKDPKTKTDSAAV